MLLKSAATLPDQLAHAARVPVDLAGEITGKITPRARSIWTMLLWQCSQVPVQANQRHARNKPVTTTSRLVVLGASTAAVPGGESVMGAQSWGTRSACACSCKRLEALELSRQGASCIAAEVLLQ
jgi:hypothetical protein